MEKRAKSAKAAEGFSAEERSAMRERAREAKSSAGAAEAEAEVVAKIAEMAGPDRAMAEALHALVRAEFPSFTAKLWYGMPAYSKDGAMLCFFQPGQKFKTRYSTLGFSDKARLDDGTMWPTSYALAEWNDTTAAQVVALLRQAAG